MFNFKFSVLFLSLFLYFFYSQCNRLNGQSKIQKINFSEIKKQIEEISINDFDIKKIETETAEIKKDIQAQINTKNSNNKELKELTVLQKFKLETMPKFRKKKLFELSVFKADPFEMQIGQNVGGLLAMAPLFVGRYKEKIFYKPLIDKYNNIITNKIINNRTSFLNLLENAKNESDIYDYIVKNQKIDFVNFIKNNKQLILLYLSSSILIDKTADFFLKETITNKIINDILNQNQFGILFGKPIIVTSIVKEYLTNKIALNYKIGSQKYIYKRILVQLLKAFIIYYASATNKKINSQTLKHYLNILDSKLFDISKKIVAINSSLKHLESNVYMIERANYLYENKETVIQNLIDYKNLKSKYPITNKSNQHYFDDIKNKILNKIKKAHNVKIDHHFENQIYSYNKMEQKITAITLIPIGILTIIMGIDLYLQNKKLATK